MFVPASSVVEHHEGNTLFVQVDGESFKRRPVKTVPLKENRVEIISHIEGNERIVVKGIFPSRTLMDQ